MAAAKRELDVQRVWPAQWPRATARSNVYQHGVVNMKVQGAGCLYLGGAVSSEVVYPQLLASGFRSVVCLECENAVRLSLRGFRPERGLFLVPVSPGQAPTLAQAESLLNLMGRRSRWPMLVHARRCDRAAGVGALARYSLDGWPLERCLDESGYGYPGLPFAKGCRMNRRQEDFLRYWSRIHAPGSHRLRGLEPHAGLRFEGKCTHRRQMLFLWQDLPADVRMVPVVAREHPAGSSPCEYAGWYHTGEVHFQECYWSEATFLHEYGHVAWYEVLGASERRDWSQFWRRSFDKMPCDYARKNVSEGFAECFEQTFLGRVPQGHEPIGEGMQLRIRGYFGPVEFRFPPDAVLPAALRESRSIVCVQ